MGALLSSPLHKEEWQWGKPGESPIYTVASDLTAKRKRWRMVRRCWLAISFRRQEAEKGTTENYAKEPFLGPKNMDTMG